MADLAELELRIKSVEAKVATQRLQGLERSARSVDGAQKKASRSSQQLAQSYGTLGRVSRGASRQLRFLAGGFLAIRAASAAVSAIADFDRGLDAVAKTTDLSEANMQRLSRSVLELGATFNPTPIVTLLDIGRAAGQLGVSGVANIEAFTKAIGNVALASDLSADAAASGLRRIQNVLQGETADIDRLGSTLVALGNNFAATESEILAVATRIAQSGSIFNVSQQDALGLAAAYRSLGLFAEISGTQTGRLFRRIEEASVTGGSKLEAFNKIVGTTGVAFADMFKQDPTEAFVAVVEGFARIQKEGGSVTRAIDSINLTSEQSLQVFPALARGIDVLREALRTARGAWIDNTAAQTEAARGSDNLIGDYGKLKNALAGLSVETGNKGLLSFLRESVQLFGDLARISIGLAPELERNARLFEALGFGLKFAATFAAGFIAAKLAAALLSIAAAAAAAGTSMGALTAIMAINPFIAVGIAIAGAAAALGLFTAETETAITAAERLNTANRNLSSSLDAIADARAGVKAAASRNDTLAEIAEVEKLEVAFKNMQKTLIKLQDAGAGPIISFASLEKISQEAADALNLKEVGKQARADLEQALLEELDGVGAGFSIDLSSMVDPTDLAAAMRGIEALRTTLANGISLDNIIPASEGSRLERLGVLAKGFADNIKLIGVPVSAAFGALDENLIQTTDRLAALSNSVKEFSGGKGATENFTGSLDPKDIDRAEAQIGLLRQERDLRADLALLSADEVVVARAVANAKKLATQAGLSKEDSEDLVIETARAEQLIINLTRLTKARKTEAEAKDEAAVSFRDYITAIEREREVASLSSNEKEVAAAVEEGLTLARAAGITQLDLVKSKIEDEIRARQVLSEGLRSETEAARELETTRRQLESSQLSDDRLLDDLRTEIALLKKTELAARQLSVMRRLSVAATNEDRLAVAEYLKEIDRLRRVNQTAENFGNAFGSALRQVVTGSGKAKDAVRGLIEAFNAEILNTVAIKPLTDRFTAALKPAADAFTKVGDAIGPEVGIDPGSAAAAQALSVAGASAGTALSSGGATAGQAIVTGAGGAANVLSSGVQAATSLAAGSVSTVVSGLAGALQQGTFAAAQATQTMLSTAAGAASQAGVGLLTGANSAALALVTGSNTAGSSLATAGALVAASIVGAAKTAALILGLTKVTGAAAGGGIGGSVAVGDAATGTVSGGGGRIRSLAAGGTSMGAASRQAARVNRSVVETVQKIGALPMHATGAVRQGLVTHPTMMMLPGGPSIVGEGMHAEAVMPAHNMGSNDMGVQAVVRRQDVHGTIRTQHTLAKLTRGPNGVMGVQFDAFATGGISGSGTGSPQAASGLDQLLVQSAARLQEGSSTERIKTERGTGTEPRRTSDSVQPGSVGTTVKETRIQNTNVTVRGDRDTTRLTRRQVTRDIERMQTRPSY